MKYGILFYRKSRRHDWVAEGSSLSPAHLDDCAVALRRDFACESKPWPAGELGVALWNTNTERPYMLPSNSPLVACVPRRVLPSTVIAGLLAQEGV